MELNMAIKFLEHHSPSIAALGRKERFQDKSMAKSMFLLAAFCAMLCTSAQGSTASGCEDDFQKIGCFEERSPNYAKLLFNDRDIIDWNNIQVFIKHMACKCNKKAKEANKARSDKYVGFAIHNWGECYGKTQADIDAVGLKEQTHRCTGDQSYSGCKNEHAGCVGHDFADYIYLLSVEAEKAINGGYSAWESWTPCKGKCGTGLRARERTCTNPLPQGKGKDCTSLGNSTEVEECELPTPCPVDGEFGSWSEYSQCSKSCGGGVQQKTRKCDSPPAEHGGKPCAGQSLQTRQCNSQKCPVDGGYSSWSGYSSCSKSCGGGTKTRYRSCTNPSPKHGGKSCSRLGSSTSTATCNTHVCLSAEYFKRTCEWHKIDISCPGSSRITITYALYGRTTKSHCRGGIDWTWSTNCRAGNSYSKVHGICEGRKSCQVYAKNNVFGDPCMFTPKYLEIKYRCKG